jgi:serine/threonine-protein kinase
MSPEQLIGRPVDGRSDLYSLGVLLFQLLTGELPAQGETMGALIDAVVNQPAPDVRSLRPRLPEAVANIVALALEKRPELRYADCSQLAADLRAVAALWRQSTGSSPEALQGAWSSPSEFAEAHDLDPVARHARAHATTQAVRPAVQGLTTDRG